MNGRAENKQFSDELLKNNIFIDDAFKLRKMIFDRKMAFAEPSELAQWLLERTNFIELEKKYRAMALHIVQKQEEINSNLFLRQIQTEEGLDSSIINLPGRDLEEKTQKLTEKLISEKTESIRALPLRAFFDLQESRLIDNLLRWYQAPKFLKPIIISAIIFGNNAGKQQYDQGVKSTEEPKLRITLKRELPNSGECVAAASDGHEEIWHINHDGLVDLIDDKEQYPVIIEIPTELNDRDKFAKALALDSCWVKIIKPELDRKLEELERDQAEFDLDKMAIKRKIREAKEKGWSRKETTDEMMSLNINWPLQKKHQIWDIWDKWNDD